MIISGRMPNRVMMTTAGAESPQRVLSQRFRASAWALATRSEAEGGSAGRVATDMGGSQSTSMRAAPGGTSMPTLSPTANCARPSMAFWTRTLSRRLSESRIS